LRGIRRFNVLSEQLPGDLSHTLYANAGSANPSGAIDDHRARHEPHAER
jgi:hypothetical protein